MELFVFVVYVLLTTSLSVVISVDNNIMNTNFTRQDFPPSPHFVFGAGSSAYQIEGAALEDGRTVSIWDTYAHDPSSQTTGNGDVAVDGYHKYKEDIQLMAKTGFEAYRFSISWSRLIPNGRGAINPKGLQYYNNFINELIANGIEPHVTLYHNDLPQVLQDEYGGWISPKSVRDFTGFADVCFREFGDRVKHWTTFNEPNAIAIVGHGGAGLMPPARCSLPFGNCPQGNSSVEPYLATHYILLSHASASHLYRTKYKGIQNGMIAITLLAYWIAPSTNATADVLAAERAMDYWVGWFLNPLVHGDYPETVKKNSGGRIPVFSENELTSVKGSLDFLTLNHYDSFYVRDGSSSLLTDNRDVYDDMGLAYDFPDGIPPPTESHIYTQGFQPLLAYVKNTYGNLPIYIHENGYRTLRSGSENLDDQSRVDIIRAFIGNLLEAVRDGSDVRGYFHWSFVDLYELMGVNASSYGLFYVDFNDKDLKRQPKKSAKWYSHFLTGSSSFGLEQVVHVEENIA